MKCNALNLATGRRFCKYSMSDEELEAAKLRVIFTVHPPTSNSIFIKFIGFLTMVFLAIWKIK